MNVKKLVIASLFCALCCVFTLAVQIPSPMEGYVNLGDCMVLASGFLLGPIYGGTAAGVGSALADVFSGYTHYAIATFLIKALMAVLAHFISKALFKHIKNKAIPLTIAAVASECLMVVGYFFFAATLLGNGLAAAASIPGNLMQGLFGTISSVALTVIILNNKALIKELK